VNAVAFYVTAANRRRRFPFVAVAAVLSLFGCSTASAAVTIGGSVSPAGGFGGGSIYCGSSSPCTMGQIAGGTAASPIDGVVVRWRIVGDGVEGLRIIRPLGSGLYTGAGTGPMQTLVGSPTVNTFAVRLPIHLGDLIGTSNPGSSSNDVSFAASPPPGVMQTAWLPPLADGESPGRAPTTGYTTAQELALEADVEADADGDGFGDESQDLCPGVFGSVSGCPKADLQLTKTATQGSESDLVTYTLVAANNGPDPAPGVAVSDALPAGAQVVSSSGPSGPCAASGGSLSCPAGTLSNGASATITIIARLKAGTQTNTATVSSAALAQAAAKTSGAGDPNPANNTASATVTVSAPTVFSVSAVPSTWRLGSLLPAFSRLAPVGTTIKFSLSEPASVKIEFLQTKPGRKVGKQCKTPTRSNARKRHCTRTMIAGSLSTTGHAGTNKLRFQGRLSRRKTLKKGHYSVRITATDAAGNRSKPKTTSITILPR
jgi:uncharacterized repeat protein (TIGR01451 family)